jgi:hypothetical protein
LPEKTVERSSPLIKVMKKLLVFGPVAGELTWQLRVLPVHNGRGILDPGGPTLSPHDISFDFPLKLVASSNKLQRSL